jgi:hypothetical protein
MTSTGAPSRSVGTMLLTVLALAGIRVNTDHESAGGLFRRADARAGDSGDGKQHVAMLPLDVGVAREHRIDIVVRHGPILYRGCRKDTREERQQ